MQIIEPQTSPTETPLQQHLNEQFNQLGQLHGIDMEMDQIEQRLNHLKGFRALKISEIYQRGHVISQLQQDEEEAKKAQSSNGKPN